MSTYKVLQDIEAEDKLIGPLTLRQFIYAGVAAINGYLTYFVSSHGASFLAVFFVPVGLICVFFAWPWSRDQPTEIWALARIRFLIKPRIRIWNQSGVKELVTVTVPRQVEHHLTNGLNEDEVRSRLRALSDTIDSRGWAVKNVNVNMYSQAAATAAPAASDRLVSGASLPQPIAATSDIDIKAADDILDVQNNPVAHQFDTMITASAKAHRQQIMERMQQASTPASTPVAPPPQPQQLQAAQPSNYWFLNQPAQQSTTVVPQDSVTFNTQVVAPGTSVTDLPVAAAAPTAAEEAFIKHLKNEPAFSPNMHGHLHVIQPLSAQKATAAMPQQPAQPPVAQPVDNSSQPTQKNPSAPKVTQAPDAAILDLARNDDLNVATIAREAQKRKEPPEDEVVISLH
jgi:hypothetical protein